MMHHIVLRQHGSIFHNFGDKSSLLVVLENLHPLW
jgi:hypothetical protein